MTNAAPDTSETRAEVARMTASRAPAPTTILHAGEPPPPPEPTARAHSGRRAEGGFAPFPGFPTRVSWTWTISPHVTPAGSATRADAAKSEPSPNHRLGLAVTLENRFSFVFQVCTWLPR